MSSSSFPKYQESSAGRIPNDWTATTLGKVAEFRGGSAFKETFQGKKAGEFPFIKVSDFNLPLNHRFIREANNWIDAEANRDLKATLFDEGAVVFAKVGAALLLNRRRVLTRKTAIDNNLMAATPRAIDPTFLYYYLQTVDFGKLVQEGAVPSVNQGQLQALPLAKPSHAEQRKIAAILTAVDDKLDVIARQIEATQTLKQGLMQTLFSRGAGIQSASGAWHPHEQFKEGPIGTVPQCWEFHTLGDLAIENITYGVVQPGEAVVGGVPMVRGGDIKDGEIAQNLRTISSEVSSQFKRTILEGGELLVSLVGYPGETAVVPAALKGANIARQAGMIRTGSLALSKYLHCYLASPAGKTELLGGMIGSAQQVINLKSLRDVQVPMPPEAERGQITAVCEATSSKLRTLSAKKRSYGLLKRGLMQKLLTGEWRVKVDADMAA